MTVGQTLTEARSQAGLSVDELSERTRIRGTVIRSIEEDDYEACGGDLYVRGYVRAIAGAVGIDAQPLIREYDMGRAGDHNERANGSTGGQATGLPSVPPPFAALTAFDLPAVPEAPVADGGPADLDATRFDLPAVSADPAVTAYDLPPVPDVPRTTEFAAVAPPAAVPPAAAWPPAAPETRFDLTALPEDLMAAGYGPKPAEPAGADSATRIIPALGTDPAGPQDPAGPSVPGLTGGARAGRGRGKRRGLVALAAVVVLAAAGGVGIYLGTGSTATKNAAALLHLDDRGVIAPGKLADLLVVDGDPSKDIAAVDNIDSVWRRGRKVADARWFKPRAPHKAKNRA